MYIVQQNGSPITKHARQKKVSKKVSSLWKSLFGKKEGVEFIRILNSSIFSQHCRESNGKMCHCKESGVLLISASAVVNMGEKTACFFFARWLDSPLWSVHIWPWSALFQQGGELRGVSYCMLTDARSEAAAFSKSHYKALTSTYPVKKWSRFSTIQYSIHDE